VITRREMLAANARYQVDRFRRTADHLACAVRGHRWKMRGCARCGRPLRSAAELRRPDVSSK
jgi:hypothetical protein